MLASIILSLFIPLTTLAAPCPFGGHECKCMRISPSDPFKIRRLDCVTNGTSLPVFSVQPGTKFSVDTMAITGGVRDIPGDYLAGFASIGTLVLTQPALSPRPVYQNWDIRAFEGPQIMHMDIYGLAGLIPPPGALGRVAYSLIRLSIMAARAPVQLDDGIWGQFAKLKTLWVRQTQIINMSDNAFVGVEGLEELTLNGALSGFPEMAIRQLAKLKSLNLNQNSIVVIPNKAFVELPALESISLGGNPLEEGAFDQIPQGMSRIYLDSVGLERIPGKILRNQPTLTCISLSNNRIEMIRKEDFVDGRSLETVILNGNPIRDIEDGAFSGMDQLMRIDLRGTNLTSIDLSNIAGGLRMAEVHFDNNAVLQYVTASDISKIPAGLIITITSTGLRTIDMILGDLLDQKRSIVLDISNSGNLFCKDYEWMARHALCTGRLRIKGATCFNFYDQPLAQYLRKVVPNLDCTGANVLR